MTQGNGSVRWGRGGLLLAALSLACGPAWAQNTLSALQTDVDRIGALARPSIVTVVAQHTVEQARGPRGKVDHRLHTRVGSGVAISEDEILTTASVVLAAEHLRVQTENGLEAEATLVGSDPIFNLAVLKVSDLRLPPLRFAEGRPLGPGDWVITLGTSYRGQPTQSVGNVAFREHDPRFAMLQLTNVVYPGNSGGAALNIRGELVGIVQGDLGTPNFGDGTDTGRRGGASFVLPTESLRPVYETLRRLGRVPHGWLGVSTRVIEVESDTEVGLRVPLGALVENVVPGGPADRLGLRRGDLIVAFEKERVEYPDQLARWVAATRPGLAVELVWARHDLQKTGRVVLDESPQATPPWAMSAPIASAPPSGSRILEIERQIQRLNRELEQLKAQSAGTPR